MSEVSDGHLSKTPRRRTRRATVWLGSAVTVHVIVGAATVAFALSAGAGPSIWTYAVISAVVAGPALLLVRERLESSRGRPAKWPPRAFAVAIPQAFAFGVASIMYVAGESWPVPLLDALIALSLQVGCAVMASRSLVSPYTADVGELGIEVEAKIRRGRAPDIPFLSIDTVTLTTSKLRLTLRPHGKVKYVRQLDLATISAIEVREATPADSPWYVLPNGRQCVTPPGKVLVVHRRSGVDVVLPVFDPRGFAEVLRVRARRACSAYVSSAPGGRSGMR